MINKQKTLIILTPGFPKDESDTTCIPARQILVKALHAVNPHITIIIIAFQYPFVKSKYKWHGVNVISFNGRNKGKLNKLIVWKNVWSTLIKIKKDHDIIGILNFWLGECALIGKFFAKKYKLKQYTWILGQDAKKENKYFPFINPKCNELIALSDFIAEEFFINYCVKPKLIIPVGIDITMFGSGFQQRDIDIMGAGSFIPLKQYDVFIEIIKELVIYFPDIKVVICGDGPEWGKLFSLINKYNLQNNISLPGKLLHHQVLLLMQRSKIFLHTSSFEGFGTVYAEALYAGTHVIGFTKPMEKLFDHFTLVKNKKEMKNKIIGLLNNKQLNYDKVLMYPVENIAKEILNLFTANRGTDILWS